MVKFLLVSFLVVIGALFTIIPSLDDNPDENSARAGWLCGVIAASALALAWGIFQ